MVRIAEFVKHLAPDPNPHQSGSGSAGSAKSATAILKRERALYVRLQRQTLAAKYHDAGKCRHRLAGCVYAVTTAMNALAESLPAELTATNRQDWTATLERRFAEMCNSLATR